jgi:cell fate regulator YaaT (PSP1 superfamily)
MPHVVAVRYGLLNDKGDFKTAFTDLVENEQVVVRTERGTEVGMVLGKPTEVAEVPAEVHGEVLRRAAETDRQDVCPEGVQQLQSELRYCRQKIREHNLPMKLVNVEHLVGGEKLIFYFIAEGRVDFRELVKDLAHEYRTRIELKQIGVRDEARLLADLDHCGREICCRSWMRRLEPVTMKMAKAQKATLDPAKISGRCGRLMCCLRYEDSVYEDLKKNLPRKGQQVVTAEMTAEVINYDILSQTVTVELPDGRRTRIKISEVTKVLPREPRDEKSQSGRQSGPRNRSAERPSRRPAQTQPDPSAPEEEMPDIIASRPEPAPAVSESEPEPAVSEPEPDAGVPEPETNPDTHVPAEEGEPT